MVEINQLSPEQYVPSASEKKKSFAMYLLLGILIGLNQTLTQYEKFHLKQSLGRWVFFMVRITIGGLIAFLPIIGIWIFFVGTLLMIVWNIIMMMGAFQGVSKITNRGLLLGMGSRLLGLFDQNI